MIFLCIAGLVLLIALPIGICLLVEKSHIDQVYRQQARLYAEKRRNAAQHPAPVETGCAIIDDLLTYGLERADDACIRFCHRVVVTPGLDCLGDDLLVIMGKTLDSAIDACTALPEDTQRIISLLVMQSRKSMYYEITNTGAAVSDAAGDDLKMIQAIVKHRNGHLETVCEKGLFSLRISMPMPSEGYPAYQ